MTPETTKDGIPIHISGGIKFVYASDYDALREELESTRQRARLWPLYEEAIKLLKYASERMLDGNWQRETESILKAIDEAKRHETT